MASPARMSSRPRRSTAGRRAPTWQEAEEAAAEQLQEQEQSEEEEEEEAPRQRRAGKGESMACDWELRLSL